MSERDDYMAYVGDCIGQAEENLMNSLTDAIEKTLEELKSKISKGNYEIVRKHFDENTPIRKGYCKNCSKELELENEYHRRWETCDAECYGIMVDCI